MSIDMIIMSSDMIGMLADIMITVIVSINPIIMLNGLSLVSSDVTVTTLSQMYYVDWHSKGVLYRVAIPVAIVINSINIIMTSIDNHNVN